MKRAILLSAASLFAVTAASPALAQEASAPAGAEAPDDSEIVVTAQLREQRISEVPMAITAYSGEFLDELGLNDFEDVARFVPGF